MSYEVSASVYDAIYTSIKDYRQEAERVRALIDEHSLSPSTSLLDVACGTGLHAQYLSQWYELEGMDLSPAQLDVARRRLPQVWFFEDDMLTFRRSRKYSTVTCLFSAIGHLRFEQMPEAIANMAHHVAPGGLLIIEPWLLPHMFKEGHFSANFVDLPVLKVARMNYARRDGRIIHLRMDHLVARPEGAQHFTDRHALTMWTADEYLGAFRAAGLEAWRNEQGLSANGRGLFIGRKSMH